MITNLEVTDHGTPDGSVWALSLTEEGTIKAESTDGKTEQSNLGRSEKQFLADLNRKYPLRGEPVTANAAPEVKSSGDWEKDKKKKYTAHFVRPTEDDPSGHFEGPTDAFVWLGHPDEGDPWVSKLPDPNNPKAKISVQPFVDQSKISASIGGVDVKWIAWDSDTGCNVYKRVN